MSYRFIPWMFFLLIQGCVTTAERDKPAPVTDARTGPIGQNRPAEQNRPVEQDHRVEVYAYRAPQKPAFAPSSPVLALVDRAGDQRAAGDLSGAAATLERALRIEPRNPHLLNRLARVRLEQRQYVQAQNLAVQSNAMAGDAPALQRDNDAIVFAARKAGAR